jgi:hypothetical protein
VRIYDPTKTVVDLFRYRRSADKRHQKSPGFNLALEGLREALRQRKATPAEIARYANKAVLGRSFSPIWRPVSAFSLLTQLWLNPVECPYAGLSIQSLGYAERMLLDMETKLARLANARQLPRYTSRCANAFGKAWRTQT